MKYLINIPESYVIRSPLKGEVLGIPLLVSATQKTYTLPTEIQLEPYTEPDRKAIEDEVWEFAKKVRLEEFIDSSGKLRGYISSFDTYQEAKAKYEEWSKQNIREGDEVIYNSRTRAVVLKPETEEKYGTILTSEFATITVSHDDLEKTGRCFPEVVELLKKMRNTE